VAEANATQTRLHCYASHARSIDYAHLWVAVLLWCIHTLMATHPFRCNLWLTNSGIKLHNRNHQTTSCSLLKTRYNWRLNIWCSFTPELLSVVTDTDWTNTGDSSDITRATEITTLHSDEYCAMISRHICQYTTSIRSVCITYGLYKNGQH